ncbi:MAG: hypothetical protein H7245_20235 [Candidatus Saccharibacteria bacterium]|nr:hypothetical protein [Pseudorhodobacter sp.]
MLDAIKMIQTKIAKTQPTRILIDSLSKFRHLAGDTATYRMNTDALTPHLNGDHRKVLISVQHGLLGATYTQAENISYIADNVVHLRYYEHQDGTGGRWAGQGSARKSVVTMTCRTKSGTAPVRSSLRKNHCPKRLFSNLPRWSGNGRRVTICHWSS